MKLLIAVALIAALILGFSFNEWWPLLGIAGLVACGALVKFNDRNKT